MRLSRCLAAAERYIIPAGASALANDSRASVSCQTAHSSQETALLCHVQLVFINKRLGKNNRYRTSEASSASHLDATGLCLTGDLEVPPTSPCWPTGLDGGIELTFYGGKIHGPQGLAESKRSRSRTTHDGEHDASVCQHSSYRGRSYLAGLRPRVTHCPCSIAVSQ